MNERLYRSVDDRMIAGVAGGMAEWLDADPGIVRLAWVVATIFTAGLAILVYIAMIIVIPEEPWVASAGSSGQVPAGTLPS